MSQSGQERCRLRAQKGIQGRRPSGPHKLQLDDRQLVLPSWTTDSPHPAAPRGEPPLHPSLMPPSCSLRQALVGIISQVGTRTYRGFKRRPLSETSNNWPLGQGWGQGPALCPDSSSLSAP